MKSVVVDPSVYNWDGDSPLRRPSARTVIYEMHLKGFTRHPSSGVGAKTRGTYAGLIEKIPYLQDLGITAVELLPIFAFDPHACPPGLINYWGYQPVSFFAPHPAYSSRQDPLGAVDEFRDMVKALHRAGIEVILDVVFNHTAEGGSDGPTLGFRGIDKPTYYTLQEERSNYADFSGCGNTLNANHPIVRRMIIDSLRYWVTEMHVDGFRFDLASILSRDSSGQVLPNPPVLWDIESDPALAGTKLIAEAWDAGGLYQVGSFVGDAWKEWNGRFRDDARDFFRGEPGAVGRLADRMLGSHEVYGHDDESTWFDWSLVEEHADIHRFVKLLLARRLLRDVTHEQQRETLTQLLERAKKSWHGVRLNQPDWGDNSHSIVFHAEFRDESLLFHLILNGYWEALEFELPPVPSGARWKRWIDTSLDSPDDITAWQSAKPISGTVYHCGPRSVVVLLADRILEHFHE